MLQQMVRLFGMPQRTEHSRAQKDQRYDFRLQGVQKGVPQGYDPF
jgi:hypothetical protein